MLFYTFLSSVVAVFLCANINKSLIRFRMTRRQQNFTFLLKNENLEKLQNHLSFTEKTTLNNLMCKTCEVN